MLPFMQPEILIIRMARQPVLSVTSLFICTCFKLCMENISLSSSHTRIKFYNTCRLTIQKHCIILRVLMAWRLTSDLSWLHIIDWLLTCRNILIRHKTLRIHLRCCITPFHLLLPPLKFWNLKILYKINCLILRTITFQSALQNSFLHIHICLYNFFAIHFRMNHPITAHNSLNDLVLFQQFHPLTSDLNALPNRVSFTYFPILEIHATGRRNGYFFTYGYVRSMYFLSGKAE